MDCLTKDKKKAFEIVYVVSQNDTKLQKMSHPCINIDNFNTFNFCRTPTAE